MPLPFFSFAIGPSHLPALFQDGETE